MPQATFVALSGPPFAQEVHEGQPTAVVAASDDDRAAEVTRRILSCAPTFRVYTQHDVVGVELAGSLKNVMAIAAGVLEGLGMGHNPRAALLARGLAEIGRLGEAMGADPLTFAGLAKYSLNSTGRSSTLVAPRPEQNTSGFRLASATSACRTSA